MSPLQHESTRQHDKRAQTLATINIQTMTARWCLCGRRGCRGFGAKQCCHAFLGHVAKLELLHGCLLGNSLMIDDWRFCGLPAWHLPRWLVHREFCLREACHRENSQQEACRPGLNWLHRLRWSSHLGAPLQGSAFFPQLYTHIHNYLKVPAPLPSPSGLACPPGGAPAVKHTCEQFRTTHQKMHAMASTGGITCAGLSAVIFVCEASP